MWRGQGPLRCGSWSWSHGCDQYDDDDDDDADDDVDAAADDDDDTRRTNNAGRTTCVGAVCVPPQSVFTRRRGVWRGSPLSVHPF
eukprot:686901-Prorocentrum_minimum.AAC.5